MFELAKFDVSKFDKILARGLSNGMGLQRHQVCIEAAICETLGMRHSDDPQCVTEAIRSFKIALNDCDWSSPAARAKGLRDLGLAQLGSLGVITDFAFTRKMRAITIRKLLPALFREVFPNNAQCLKAAACCETEGRQRSVLLAYHAARNVWMEIKNDKALSQRAEIAMDVANTIIRAIDSSYYADIVDQTAHVFNDKYLLMSAGLALEVLKELKSPGVALL